MTCAMIRKAMSHVLCPPQEMYEPVEPIEEMTPSEEDQEEYVDVQPQEDDVEEYVDVDPSHLEVSHTEGQLLSQLPDNLFPPSRMRFKRSMRIRLSSRLHPLPLLHLLHLLLHLLHHTTMIPRLIFQRSTRWLQME